MLTDAADVSRGSFLGRPLGFGAAFGFGAGPLLEAAELSGGGAPPLLFIGGGAFTSSSFSMNFFFAAAPKISSASLFFAGSASVIINWGAAFAIGLTRALAFGLLSDALLITADSLFILISSNPIFLIVGMVGSIGGVTCISKSGL